MFLNKLLVTYFTENQMFVFLSCTKTIGIKQKIGSQIVLRNQL